MMNVLSWKISLKGKDEKDIFISDDERKVIESLWDDYLNNGRNRKIEIGISKRLISDIKSIEALTYKKGEGIRRPAYEHWFCTWCNTKNKWNIKQCECQRYEIDQRVSEDQLAYDEWCIKNPKLVSEFPLIKWLKERIKRKFKLLIS